VEALYKLWASITIATKINGVLHIAEINTPRCPEAFNFFLNFSKSMQQVRIYLVKVVLAGEYLPILGLNEHRYCKQELQNTIN
jgi:hypothetical protein